MINLPKFQYYVNVFTDSFRASYRDSLGFNFHMAPMFPTLRVGGIEVWVDNMQHQLMKMGKAQLPTAEVTAVIGTDGVILENVAYVRTGDIVEKAPQHIREAIYAHEAGHIANKDYLYTETRGRELRREHLADCFAQDHGYDMFAALQWLIEHPCPMLDKEEIRQRIAMLKCNSTWGLGL